MKLNKILFTAGLAALISMEAKAQTPIFTPGQLAVLQLGDGQTNRCSPLGATTGITNYQASDIMGSRQTALYIDQFNPNGINQSVPSVQVAVPTNGQAALMINGNAGTEGNLTLSGDKSVLAVAGYAGDLLSLTTGGQTAPSNLSYDRGIDTIDAFGNVTSQYRGNGWYGTATGKTNPRGVATDGLGGFWGCGNGYGSLYINVNTMSQPIQFQNIALTSCSKVINSAVYSTVKGAESVNLYPAGIYSFVDFNNNPVAYPNSASFLKLYLQAQAPYTNCIGFDINPQQTIAYVADAGVGKGKAPYGGIQKYVRSGLGWKFAYNLSIPGYTNHTTGIYSTRDSLGLPTDVGNTNVLVGCFSLTVDWSGANPVVYATTADCGNDNQDPYYGNRVVRINDTNTVQSGANLIATTNFLTTVVMPPIVNGLVVTNMVFKSVTFTPDLRPQITANPVNWSAVDGDAVSFSVSASSATAFQWYTNGTALAGATSSTVSLSSVTLGDNGSSVFCVVGNSYGSVTSSVATLTVNASAVAPVIAAAQNITNYVGNNQTIAASISGTDPKGGYQWYYNGVPLADANEFSGTQTATLSITQLSINNQGTYSLAVTNVGGSVTSLVANLYTVYAPPALVQPPSGITTFIGRGVTNAISAYGQLLTYKWYFCSSASSSASANLKPMTDTGDFSGTATASLVVSPAAKADSSNYVVVVSSPGGSITSAPAALAVLTAPAHTFVNYSAPGQVYSQTFNSLPVNGGSSADAANPQGLYAETNALWIQTNIDFTVAATLNTYSLDNPTDFGYPIIPAGFIGGLGLSNTMSGWYSFASSKLRFGATYGDQSAGGFIDLGQNFKGDGASLVSITNRALGLIGTTATGVQFIGVGFTNNTGQTLGSINLSYLGELWRNNPNAQTLQFGYAIDAAGNSATFQPTAWDATNGIHYVSSLDVSFPTSVGTAIVDGTQSSNQVSKAASNLAITNWPAGATLWLVWQAQTLGTAQAVAIDNLQFSASPAVVLPVQPVTITASSVQRLSSGAFQFGFTNVTGVIFSVLSTTNAALPLAQWQNLGHPTEVTSGQYQFTDTQATNVVQRYYRLSQP